MQAAKLPASAGWQWVRDGLALFLRQPLAMFTWAMAISLAVMFASLTPPLGPLAFVVLLPCITFLTLSVCRHVDAGRPVHPGLWLQPLRNKGLFKRLLGMGSLYAALCILSGVVIFMPFMSDLSDAMQTAAAINDLQPVLVAMRIPLAIFGAVYVCLAALFWYAPALSGFLSTRLTQALFFSGVACWRNKAAFVVYGLTWAAVFFAIDFAGSLLVVMGLPASVAALIQVPVNVAAGSVLYCSFFPSYISVFGSDATGLQLDR